MAREVSKKPTAKQRVILDAFIEIPVYAQVARDLGYKDDGHVRRLVRQFPEYVEEGLRQRADERRAQAAANRAILAANRSLVTDWGARGLQQALTGLDFLAASENESVSLRALRFKLDIAIGAFAPLALATDVDNTDAVTSVEQEVADRLHRLAEYGNEQGHDGGDHDD